MANHLRLGGWLLLAAGVGLGLPGGPRFLSAHEPREWARLRGHTNDVYSLAITPDGKTLVSGSRDKTIRLWDLAAARERATLKGHTGEVVSVVVTADAATLVSGSGDGTVRLWDLATGRERSALKGHAGNVFLALTADGRTLASGSEYGERVRLQDLATGKELMNLRIQVRSLAMTADGKTLAWHAGKLLTLWDVATGKERTVLAGHRGVVLSMAFTPDGKTLAAGASDGMIKLWEVVTGKERASWKAHTELIRSLALRADARILASGGDDGRLRIWDLTTGKECATLKGEFDTVWAVAFTPDGKTLAAADGPDTTIRLWDVSDLGRPDRVPTVSLSDRECEALWEALAAADAAGAYRAIWSLAAAPGQAVPWLKARLRPTAPADPKRLAGLIADLDSEEFSVREQATRALADLGESALPALRKALTGRPSAETRQRVEPLLADLERPANSPERLRVLRAVEVLEYIGTAEARQVLEALAGGMPEARLTQEARASLNRLAAAPARGPKGR
jgi:hypothetical protein